MNKKVLVTVVDPNNEILVAVAKPLLDAGMQVDYNFLHHTQDAQVVIDAARGYDYVIAGSEIWNRAVLSQTVDKLKMLVRYGVGMDSVDIPAAIELGICVSNTPGANAHQVAEHQLGMVLCLVRNIAQYDYQMKNGIWSVVVTPSLEGIVGIVGLGAIGLAFAKLLQPFPVEIIAYDPYPNQKAKDSEIRFVPLEELMKSSDFVSLNLPCNDQTRGIIGKDMLSLMKADAYLINTSRGGVIDQDALVDVLRSKRIAGAALDVFEQEPISPDDPLTKLDNVVLTPHSASASTSGLHSVFSRCVRNILDFEAGKVFDGLFNPECLENFKK